MSLVVEDGSGLAGAESYCSVAAANARHTALGNAAWTGADAVKEAALRRATQYMLQTYRNRWNGTRITQAQALDWPRWGVIVDTRYYVLSNSVPADVANACADLALKAITEDLSPDLDRAVIRERVGPLETEYNPYSPQAKRFTAINAMLAPYLKGSSAMAEVVRA